MMSVSNVSAGAAASGYYKAEGYYVADSAEANAASSWFGKAAEDLVSRGQAEFGQSVDDTRFSEMLEGHAPPSKKDDKGNWQEGQTLGRIVDGERQHRPGIDLTFSASKSVSVMALVVGDERVIAAHDDAVKAAMTLVEDRFVLTRREVNGEMQTVPGKMIAGLFRHDTSRALDPQLHTHAVIQNMVLGEDGKWTALTNEQIYNNKMLIGAVYRNALGQNLEKIGYDVERVGHNGITEIKGVPRDLMDVYSKRRQEIEEALEKRGTVPTAKDSALAALATRRNKAQGVDREELRAAWRDEARGIGYSIDTLTKVRDDAQYAKATQLPGVSRDRELGVSPAIRAENAVEFAITHVSERAAVYSSEDIVKTALNRVKGAGLQEIEAVIKAKEENGRLIPVHVHEWREIESKGGFGIGIIKAHGAAPYQNKEGNRGSYFVTIETGKGEHTIWGVGLAEAIHRSQAQVGDKIRLERQLQTPVTVIDASGREVNTHRNTWQIDNLGKAAVADREVTVRNLYTDNATLAAERQVLDEYREGVRAGGVSLEGHPRKTGSPKFSPQGYLVNKLQQTNLTDGQKDLVVLGLSPDKGRFVGVQGYAGTGKTYALASLARYAAGAGYTVEGIAPTNRAAEQLAEAVPASKTVARFKIDASNAPAPADKSRSILVVDEAGMLSTSDMRDVMTQANRSGYARVILVGDVKQLDAVSAGSPFMQLQKAGMPTALMMDIQRQRDEGLKEAVLHSIRGEVKQAFERISDIRTPAKTQTLSQKVAESWTDLRIDDRDKATVLVLTNKTREAVNNHIRDHLKGEKRLGATDTTLNVLAALNLTQAQARTAESYQVGDIVVPQKAIKSLGLAAGQAFRVEDKSDRSQSLTLRPEAGGDPIKVSLKTHGRDAPTLSAFTSETRAFADGDRVKFGITDRSTGILNGVRGTIQRVESDGVRVRLDDGRSVALQTDALAARGMDHAYAATAHDLQGSSVDRIIVGMSPHEQLSTQKAFYVAISRAKDKVTLVTTEPGKLSDRIEQNTGIRATALDAQEQKLRDDARDKEQGAQRGLSEADQHFNHLSKTLKEREYDPDFRNDREMDVALQEMEQKQKVKEGPIR